MAASPPKLSWASGRPRPWPPGHLATWPPGHYGHCANYCHGHGHPRPLFWRRPQSQPWPRPSLPPPLPPRPRLYFWWPVPPPPREGGTTRVLKRPSPWASLFDWRWRNHGLRSSPSHLQENEGNGQNVSWWCCRRKQTKELTCSLSPSPLVPIDCCDKGHCAVLEQRGARCQAGVHAAPSSIACYLARLTKWETILPHVSTLGNGERWPRCTTVCCEIAREILIMYWIF